MQSRERQFLYLYIYIHRSFNNCPARNLQCRPRIKAPESRLRIAYHLEYKSSKTYQSDYWPLQIVTSRPRRSSRTLSLKNSSAVRSWRCRSPEAGSVRSKSLRLAIRVGLLHEICDVCLRIMYAWIYLVSSRHSLGFWVSSRLMSRAGVVVTYLPP